MSSVRSVASAVLAAVSVALPAATGSDTTATVRAGLTSTVVGVLKRPLSTARCSRREIALRTFGLARHPRGLDHDLCSDDLELAPQPGLSGLDPLLDGFRRAGLPVRLQ